MLEPLSLTVGTYMLAGFAGLGSYARSSTGVSLESGILRKAANTVNIAARRSESLFGWKTKTLQQLRATVAESIESGADDDDAVDIDPRALALAEAIVDVLPEGFPLPEFASEPDGSISMDWIRSRHRMFSVSVGVTNRLACAWIDGSRRGHAVEPFDGTRLPEFIVAAVREMMG